MTDGFGVKATGVGSGRSGRVKHNTMKWLA